MFLQFEMAIQSNIIELDNLMKVDFSLHEGLHFVRWPTWLIITVVMLMVCV
jgi:hypothetical protein